MQKGPCDMTASSRGDGEYSAPGSQVGRKAPWHAPVLKRLDIDLTAGNKRNSNDSPTAQNQFLNS